MTQLNTRDTRASDALIQYLEKRVNRISQTIETATAHASDRVIREGGNQLIDRIQEMMEELRDLRATDSDDLIELAESFHRRLYLAEKRVETWPVPENAKKRSDTKTTLRGPHRPKRQAA